MDSVTPPPSPTPSFFPADPWILYFIKRRRNVILLLGVFPYVSLMSTDLPFQCVPRLFKKSLFLVHFLVYKFLIFSCPFFFFVSFFLSLSVVLLLFRYLHSLLLFFFQFLISFPFSVFGQMHFRRFTMRSHFFFFLHSFLSFFSASLILSLSLFCLSTEQPCTVFFCLYPIYVLLFLVKIFLSTNQTLPSECLLLSSLSPTFTFYSLSTFFSPFHVLPSVSCLQFIFMSTSLPPSIPYPSFCFLSSVHLLVLLSLRHTLLY